MTESRPQIILGVDTHLDAHVVAAITTLGQALGTRSIPTTPKGYQDLLDWAHDLGRSRRSASKGRGPTERT